MLSHMWKAGLVLCLLLMGFGVETKAQEPAAATTTTSTISPAKRELIKELIALTGDQQTAEAVVNSMLDQNEKDMEEMIARMLQDGSPLTPSEQVTFQQKMREQSARMSKRFRELFSQRVNFSQLMDDISYPIYDKFFNESELRDLIEFYKTPTGRKTIKVYPQLFTESMTMTSEMLRPKIRQIMDEIMEEEKPRLKYETPPPPKTKRRRRRS